MYVSKWSKCWGKSPAPERDFRLELKPCLGRWEVLFAKARLGLVVLLLGHRMS